MPDNLPAWVSTIPQAALDELPNTQSIMPAYGPRGGSVHVLKFANMLRVEFRNMDGDTIWYQEFQGI